LYSSLPKIHVSQKGQSWGSENAEATDYTATVVTVASTGTKQVLHKNWQEGRNTRELWMLQIPLYDHALPKTPTSPTEKLFLCWFHLNMSKQVLHKPQPFFNSVGGVHAQVHMLLYAISKPQQKPTTFFLFACFKVISFWYSSVLLELH